jgi:F0F1-type ATP synthase membrane subunit b/b'
MSQWSVFGVDITPKFTDDIKNVLKVTSKKEIFFDVFECMYNGKTIIVEKVGTSDGLPVVSFEAVKNNKKYKCEALLVESEESELFLNENHLQFLKSIQKTPIKTIIEEKVEKVIPTNTVYEDKVRDVSEKIIKESQEKAQKLYDNKLKEYKKHKQLIAKQAEEYLNEKTESIRQELYEQYIDFLSSNDKKVNNLVKSNIDDITLSIDENNKEILSKVDKLSNLNKEELAKILSENIININNNLDSKVKDLNDQLDIILHDSNTKLNKLDEKTSRLLEKNIKHTDEIVKNITSKIEQVDEKIEDYKIDTFKHVVEKVADNKTEIEASLKNTISKINEQVDIKRDEVEKILAAELSNINEKLNIFSEEEDKKYKQLLENLNNLNKGEVKEILSEKINDKQLNSLKLDISKQFQNEMMSIKRLIEMSSGGGSVAKQFANGGTMDGSLNVTQNILSGGTDLLDIFNTDT